ncbi:LysR substrate-binding domain-containing protein [Pseudomonas sp. LS1212]|uniref:LysR substrate-binding domain-containing protein n=1 Tax=Pseudomonas sp. LS1212 TaxID=2972478 RepID=UPI00215D4388|nr:LysR substrate-binding domain-containing protein [Pseudomonas sp. LS1212]UVJ42366.1 LysR substrate-binding domain-containing protein [Pseudomonas sp. LS1212]
MRLRHIEVIQAILQTGNLSAAAQLLHISQPAVSKTLQHAEQQLGFLLFARVRGKLQPTREALELQGEINHLYEDLDRVRRLASSLRQHQDQPLRVVCTPALAQELLPQSVAALRRRFRETPCNLSSQHTREIVRSLLLRESELGLSLHSPDHPAIQCVELAAGKLQLLAPHGWLQLRHKYIGLQELAGQTMVGLDGQDPLSLLLDAKLQALQPPPLIQTRVQTYQMMRSMVEAGEGLAVVDPFTAIGAKAAGLDVCPISPAIPVTLYALTLSECAPSPALKALLEIITEKAQAMLGR